MSPQYTRSIIQHSLTISYSIPTPSAFIHLPIFQLQASLSLSRTCYTASSFPVLPTCQGSTTMPTQHLTSTTNCFWTFLVDLNKIWTISPAFDLSAVSQLNFLLTAHWALITLQALWCLCHIKYAMFLHFRMWAFIQSALLHSVHFILFEIEITEPEENGIISNNNVWLSILQIV
jgi:hypothetical protein